MSATTSNADDMRTKLRAIFDKFDTNHSDTISTAELKQVIAATKIKVSPAEVQRMIGEADSDGSGEIEFEEVRQSSQIPNDLMFHSPYA